MPVRRITYKQKPYIAWRFFAVALLLCLLILRVNLWTSTTANNHQVSQNLFNETINDQLSVLRHRFEVYADTLYSSRSFLLNSSLVNRSSWNNFVLDQNIQQRYPGVYSVNYVNVINASQKGAYTAQLNANRFTGENKTVAIYPNSTDPKLAVLTYIAPASVNQNTIGYDLFTNENQALALNAAASQDKVRATDPFTPMNDLKTKAILLAAPIYNGSAPIDTVSERMNALSGYTVIIVDVKPLLDSALAQINDGDISLGVTTAGKTIYSYGTPPKTGAMKKTVLLNVSGQDWQLNYEAPDTLGLGTTAKLTPFLLIISSVPLILFYLLAFYFSIRYFQQKKHCRENHEYLEAAKTEK